MCRTSTPPPYLIIPKPASSGATRLLGARSGSQVHPSRIWTSKPCLTSLVTVATEIHDCYSPRGPRQQLTLGIVKRVTLVRPLHSLDPRPTFRRILLHFLGLRLHTPICMGLIQMEGPRPFLSLREACHRLCCAVPLRHSIPGYRMHHRIHRSTCMLDL